ncbi:MAG: L-aspartate oxidase [Lachnospiraceae bacterium]|nr:L-aspartate oxidase [Lachnospiraceae bacterium]
MEKEYDIMIVGNGVAGLFTALHLPADKRIAIITKGDMEESDSFLAQGGICVLKNEDDYAVYFEDTMRAGHYENNKQAVEKMIRDSQDIIRKLVDFGVEFERQTGEFCFTREGAHSTSRILYHDDVTGREITSKLLKRVQERENITVCTHTTMVDILVKDNTCYGIVAELPDKTMKSFLADYTVWACGGIGGLYEHSTNFRQLTGDALAISMKYGIELENVDYVQIHPTTLYSKRTGRRFLISESVRGEGAVLYDKNRERFTDEMQPRDVVANAIYRQMKQDKTNYVMLSLEKMLPADIVKRFPNIYKRCLEEGYDITKECIPVVPAQHYFMGGVKVDLQGRTSMKRLYAAGETACNGVHGANRLASNSLLESLVWARAAAADIMADYRGVDITQNTAEELAEMCRVLERNTYEDVMSTYHNRVRERIREDGRKRQGLKNADLWNR